MIGKAAATSPDAAASPGDRAAGGRLRFARAMRSDVVRGAGLSLGLRVGISALNLIMLTLVARSMDSRHFGLFAFDLNGLTFLAVAAGLGQEKLILRQWQEYRAAGAWDLLRGALGFGIAVTVFGSLALGAAVVGTGLVVGSDPALLAAAAAFLVAQTALIYSSHVNRAMIGILSGGAHEMTWRAVVVAAVAVTLVSGAEADPTTVLAAAAAGMAVGLALQVASAWRHRPAALRESGTRQEARLWAARSLRMGLGSNLEAASQYLEVIAVGLVLSPAAAGGYFVASRLANIFLMVSSGFDSYTTRRIPEQYFAHGRPAVVATLRKLSLLTTLPVLVGLCGMVILGRPLLGLFGPGFVAQYPILVVLSLGTTIVALSGPTAPILLLTGHEGTYSLLLGASLALRFVALVAAAWLYGPLGAAAASAVSAALGAAMLNAACRRRAGLDPAVTNLWPGAWGKPA